MASRVMDIPVGGGDPGDTKESSPTQSDGVVYVLALEKGRFYVGRTADLNASLAQHQSGAGANAWLSRYPPVRVAETVPNAPFAEMATTLRYMSEHGLHMVRGAQWCQEELGEDDEVAIALAIRNEQNRCLRCGNGTHFERNCFARASSDPFPMLNREPIAMTRAGRDAMMPPGYVHSESARGSHGSFCYRCGRTSHIAPDCFAQTHIKGYRLR
jgi:predicted GIY-YIG superfamily endonuclease